jgi:PTS system cellobiose-specific IIC component
MIPIIIAGSLGVLINAIIFVFFCSGYVSLLVLIAKAVHPEFE